MPIAYAEKQNRKQTLSRAEYGENRELLKNKQPN
jgi:hypothetical protein